MVQLKTETLRLCTDYVTDRITTAQSAIEAAQQSANDETKSSAGDNMKPQGHDATGSRMGRKQLAEAQILKQSLDHIRIERSEGISSKWKLVFTNKGIFYISISAGRLSVEGETIFAISTASPLGEKLLGQKQDSQINFNGQAFKILKVV